MAIGTCIRPRLNIEAEFGHAVLSSVANTQHSSTSAAGQRSERGFSGILFPRQVNWSQAFDLQNSSA